MTKKSILILCFVMLLPNRFLDSAGPALDTDLKMRIDFNYQYGIYQMPAPDEDEPDTADFLIPNHKTMLRIRRRFTEKDICVLRYELREYTIRENSYRRFQKPLNYEFDHRIKLGIGYASSAQVFPYFFYEYVRSLNNQKNYSGIFGARINLGLATMFEPTYTLSFSNSEPFHILILRCQQIITPRTYIMLKNNLLFPNFANPASEINWSNLFEPFIAHRLSGQTALQIGYRHFINFTGAVSHTIWTQFIQYLSKRHIIWTRIRSYIKPPLTPEEHFYRSVSLEFRITQKSLSSKGNLKNCTLNIYNIFYKNNARLWADVVGIELNYMIPK